MNRVQLKASNPSYVMGWKLLRLRNDGTLGPLFINRRLVIPVGEWLSAEDHPTKGYQRRPGWHAAPERYAPHLSEKGRIWCPVVLKNWVLIKRPAAQGAAWYLAEQMLVLPQPLAKAA